jgi:hypothetical protein
MTATTPPQGSRAAAAAAANRAATFLPVSGWGTAPAVQVAGVMASLYVDGDGVVQFALDLDGAADWLILPDGTVPACGRVQGAVVYRAGPECQDPANADCTHDHEACGIYAEQFTRPSTSGGPGRAARRTAGAAGVTDQAGARLLAWLTAPDYQID